MNVGDLVEIRGTVVSVNDTPEFRQLEIKLGPNHTVWVKEVQAQPSTTEADIRARIDAATKPLHVVIEQLSAPQQPQVPKA